MYGSTQVESPICTQVQARSKICQCVPPRTPCTLCGHVFLGLDPFPKPSETVPFFLLLPHLEKGQYHIIFDLDACDFFETQERPDVGDFEVKIF